MLGNLEDQMEHLYHLYRCSVDCKEEHETMYDCVLCGLDQLISRKDDIIDDLEGALRR